MARASKGLLAAAVATTIAIGLLIALGSWQLARLGWKEALVARVTERMAEAPVPVPPRSEWKSLDLDAWAYRRVRLDGVFDHAKEARVYVNLSQPNGRLKGPGFFVMTPFRLNDGGVVVVNRGFVPEAAADPATRPQGQVAGPTTVIGPLRAPEDRNMFTPADDPAKRLFFARDAAAIAAGLGLADAAPFTVDADATENSGGLPQGGETRVSFPNRHLEYALTWYGLAATLAAVFCAFAFRRLRGGEG